MLWSTLHLSYSSEPGSASAWQSRHDGQSHYCVIVEGTGVWRRTKFVLLKPGLRSPSRISNNTTPDVQLNHFLHRTPKLGILSCACWNGTIYFETFIATENSCSVPRYPLIAIVATKLLTAKLHSCYANESEPVDRVGNFGKIGVGHLTSDSATLFETINNER